jgi:hypothetical protein
LTSPVAVEPGNGLYIGTVRLVESGGFICIRVKKYVLRFEG